MSFSLASRLAWLEIRGGRGFSASFVLSLSLGLIGILAIDAVKQALTRQMQGRATAILGADLTVSATRPLTAAEHQSLTMLLPPNTSGRQEVTLMSMATAIDQGSRDHDSTQPRTRLVEIRAVDQHFPFYGILDLEKAGQVSEASHKDIITTPAVWIYPELLVQLGVKIGDRLKIGQQTFTITDVVRQDPSVASFEAMVAPRVFLSHTALASTGLVATGSRVQHRWLFKLPDPATTQAAAEQLARQIATKLATSDIQIRSAATASTELGRLLTYLNDYLGLVALVALFLAGVGSAYLFRSFLGRRQQDIAIMLSIGATAGLIRRVYIIQLLVLGTAASVLANILVFLILPILPLMFGKLLPEEMQLVLRGQSIGLIFGLGVGSCLFFCLPLLAGLGHISPAHLFHEEMGAAGHPPKKLYHWLWLPAAFAFWLLAVYQANSLPTGSIFMGTMIAAGLVLTLAGSGLLAGLKLVLRQNHLQAGVRLPWHLAGLNLTRRPSASLACFLALSLGALLLNVLPQLRRTLMNELTQPMHADQRQPTPSLFLFDIQSEQVEPLQKFIGQRQRQLAFLSPLIRARLLTINGQPPTPRQNAEELRGREEENAERARHRGYNLSYRDQLADSETLIAGRAFSGRFVEEAGKLAEISLEKRFAERLGVDLGDQLSFDVQGVPMTGVVVNLRQVRWTSFQPNFFVQWQPGAIDEAPKTFVAAIPSRSSDGTKLTTAAKANLQNELVERFPNVSIIDVDAAITRLLAIMEQITTAITVMALITTLAGLAVLFTIVHEQAQSRQRDVALLKILGANFALIRQLALAELFMLGAAASFWGGLMGLLASYILSTQVFQTQWQLALEIPLTVGIAVTLVALCTGMLGAARSLRTPPLSLLHGGDVA